MSATSLQNEGAVDRVLRVVLGVIVLSLTAFGPKSAWGWIGLLPLITGFVGFCPLYRALGINSCRAPLVR